MAAFALLLRIAATNVANILLARAAARTREIAIRLSVGARRGRLMQQLLTESAIIALAGGVFGSLLFFWALEGLIPWLLTAIPGAAPLRIDTTPDPTVFWFALGLTVVTALVFGLIPARQASRPNVQAAMKQDAADSTSGHGWLRGTLIGAQVALCTTLLIPAGLLTRALYAAHTFDPGFDHRDVMMVSVDFRGPRYENANAAIFQEQWLERVTALPGVERIALASRFPLSPGRSQTTFRLAGQREGHVVEFNAVSPEFFSVLGLPIVRGRVFTDGEIGAALVTESTARRYWPEQDAVGRLINVDGQAGHIVGIVRDAQLSQAHDAVSSYVYFPVARGTQRRISVLVRTAADVERVAAAVRAETSRMDESLVANVAPLTDNLRLLETLSEITAGTAGIVSLLGLSLAAGGVYGVVAYVVSRRRREVGVRLALGASARDVQRLILHQTLRPVAIGMLLGIVAAAAAAQLLHGVLFGVSPFDLIAFVGAPLLMVAIAAAAALLPTRRAMQVNPMSVLRAE
jgi:predicted permease